MVKYEKIVVKLNPYIMLHLNFLYQHILKILPLLPLMIKKTRMLEQVLF